MESPNQPNLFPTLDKPTAPALCFAWHLVSFRSTGTRTFWTKATKRRFSLPPLGRIDDNIWVCLKIGYTPNYSHLIGIMIINTIGLRGVHYIFRHTHITKQFRVLQVLQATQQFLNDFLTFFSFKRHLLVSVRRVHRRAPFRRPDGAVLVETGLSRCFEAAAARGETQTSTWKYGNDKPNKQ